MVESGFFPPLRSLYNECMNTMFVGRFEERLQVGTIHSVKGIAQDIWPFQNSFCYQMLKNPNKVIKATIGWSIPPPPLRPYHLRFGSSMKKKRNYELLCQQILNFMGANRKPKAHKRFSFWGAFKWVIRLILKYIAHSTLSVINNRQCVYYWFLRFFLCVFCFKFSRAWRFRRNDLLYNISL